MAQPGPGFFSPSPGELRPPRRRLVPDRYVSVRELSPVPISLRWLRRVASSAFQRTSNSSIMRRLDVALSARGPLGGLEKKEKNRTKKNFNFPPSKFNSPHFPFPRERKIYFV